MADDSDIPIKNQKQKERNFLDEVAGSEKQLWTVVHSKGLLHSDALDLYHKVCIIYEKIFLSNNDLEKLHETEYSLWKLHYRHIDEFRKRIKKISADSERTKTEKAQNPTNLQKSYENHTARFKSFLSESTEFYKKLLQSMRKQYEESSNSTEMKKTKTYQFLCHRFLVCLGDISRYREQYGILDIHFHKWSVSASHYLEAAKIWPDSGNPQNQMAVLATYVGDEFLALYHCVRSLAVKEPFPDAWDNLILLFEKNSSSHLQFFSKRVQFDFLKPTEKSSFFFNSHPDDDSSKRIMETVDINSLETNLWPLIIRMMSFFFLKFSLVDFLWTFACVMSLLEALMEVDDIELMAALESYSRIDSVKTGPFRAVHLVSVLIFMLQNVFNRPEVSGSKEVKDFAMAGVFVCIGRLVDRCLRSNKLDSCPLLPAIAVFVEWFGGIFGEEDDSGIDENSQSSMSYFFDVFVNLLENLRADSCHGIPLWEDFELRGFAPMAASHELLDFSTCLNHIDSFEGGAKDRAFRILNAAIKISNRSNGSRQWIIYDEPERKFYTVEMNKIREEKELEKMKSKVSYLHMKELDHDINGNSAAIEEEEVILFKPLARYNSAPPDTSPTGNCHSCANDSDQTQALPSDECLRRATSFLLPQNLNDPGDGSHFSETLLSPGPPSLSAWNLNRISSSNNIEKGIDSFSKTGLRSIEETIPTLFDDLKLCDGSREESETIRSYSSIPYLVPEPSAPLLPEDAEWYYPVHSQFSDCKTSGSINNDDKYSAASQKFDIPDPAGEYSSPRQMTSSEWLRRYQQNQNIDWINRNQMAFDHLGQFVHLTAYGASRNLMEPIFPNYWYGGIPDVRNEQLLLLQYLKEKEWQLQQDPNPRGPAYMGN